MSLFKIFKSPAGCGPFTSQHRRERNPEAGIGRRRWPGTLQGTHRRSAGQGKCYRDSLSVVRGIPECSSGLTFSTRSSNPELHSGIPC
ncbi:unnamed protein product, partial [Staurois parvus]